MGEILEVLSYFVNFRFVLLVLMGSVAGLFVGAIPGLSVSMATALLVSVTYSWNSSDALATIMGVYVVGVFSGSISAILINIPGAPSSVVTTLDGYPLAQRGEGYRALKYATVYSFFGSVFGLLVLGVMAAPISSVALRFTPMDYFLLALFGLAAVGSLTAKSFSKGLVSALLGVTVSMVGLDSVMGTPRLTFGIYDLQAGINIVPALVGLFGFAEV
ncbi:MAG: tripartite tricarboxylate transporter permease, partial [Angelakisella sp.]